MKGGKLSALKELKTKPELAELLGVSTVHLTSVLYRLKPDTQYTTFTIPKKSGGVRTISAPSQRLKSIQAYMSELLQDCRDDINKANKKENSTYKATLAHGFVRERSIITNAVMHLHQKHVLNIDLLDFFDAFNFGRVRGFFIANRNFKLAPDIATVIAQIACFEDALPQGSPCSPIITNLITHSMDIRLAAIAKRYSCRYTRYADDITISTRENVFPSQIMRIENDEFILGKKLKSEIRRSGFEINPLKTRIQYKDSRQDVTGLVVNKKPNVKREYFRTARAQCHSLFRTGTFSKTVNGVEVQGNINELEGQLNFIDQVDVYNRRRTPQQLNPAYQSAKHIPKTNTWSILSGREKTLSRFWFYRLFYGNNKPTILCEGKTDNAYLKSAISELVASYPKLASPKSSTNGAEYRLWVRFLEYTQRTRFLLQLYGGSTYLGDFISSFGKKYSFYKAPNPQHPVIIVLDNDKGFIPVKGSLAKVGVLKPKSSSKDEEVLRSADYIHVMHNLYIVLTPRGEAIKHTSIEDLFDNKTKELKVSGKSFNPNDNRDNAKEYGKEVFAKKVIRDQKSSIDFGGFKPLLDRIVSVIDHYESIK